MKRKIMSLALCALVLGMHIGHKVQVKHEKQAHAELVASDAYIRNRVLLLKSEKGSCTAIEIKSPSGALYTLTAEHCSSIFEDGTVPAYDEMGTVKKLRIIDSDPMTDLMLLESFDGKSIDIAKESHIYQRVHTLTHGRGLPTFRTDGELLGEQTVQAGELINSQEDMDRCSIERGRSIEERGFMMVCIHELTVQNATAWVLPGSSGGPLLNEAGELVGITSCSDGSNISGFVPLHTILDFLSKY